MVLKNVLFLLIVLLGDAQCMKLTSATRGGRFVGNYSLGHFRAGSQLANDLVDTKRDRRLAEHLSRLRAIDNASKRTSSAKKIEGLDKYYLYDTSAKTAAANLSTWLYENDIPLPLFPNRLEDASIELEKPPKVCISIVSSRRAAAPVSYLTQTVLSLLARMDYFKHRDDVYIHVFNVDNNPDSHEDMNIIKGIVPITNVKVPTGDTGNFTDISHVHENLDNAYIMRKMLKLGCQYPIFVEDDAIADEHWFDLLQIAMDQISSRQSDWFAIRLFSARPFYPPLFSAGISDYDPTFGSVVVLVNPRHINDYAQGLESTVWDSLAKHNEKILLPKDIVLGKEAEKHHAPLLSFEPVIFQHVGLFSSVRQSVVNKEYANFWILFSEYFNSDGKPIVFDEQRWGRDHIES